MIYFVQFGSGGPIKIGFTECLTDRLKQLEWQFGRELDVLAVIPGDRAKEREIHDLHRDLWLDRELFSPAPRLMAFIAENGEPWTDDDEPSKRSLVSLKGSPEMERWLDGLVDHVCAGNRSTLARQALKCLAGKHGLAEAMPRR